MSAKKKEAKDRTAILRTIATNLGGVMATIGETLDLTTREFVRPLTHDEAATFAKVDGSDVTISALIQILMGNRVVLKQIQRYFPDLTGRQVDATLHALVVRDRVRQGFCRHDAAFFAEVDEKTSKKLEENARRRS